MDEALLTYASLAAWQWINLISCACMSALAAVLSMALQDQPWAGLKRWTLSLLSVASGIVTIAQIEVLGMGAPPHRPSEILLNLACAGVLLAGLAALRSARRQALPWPLIDKP